MESTQAQLHAEDFLGPQHAYTVKVHSGQPNLGQANPTQARPGRTIHVPIQPFTAHKNSCAHSRVGHESGTRW